MNPPAWPVIKQIEDAAAQVQRHVLRAADHASAGDLRRAHAEAETAQGLCRRLKEFLGSCQPEQDRASARVSSPAPSRRQDQARQPLR